MIRNRLYLVCISLFALYMQSCTEPEPVDVELIEHFPDETTAIQKNDIESYITGKCLMLSFEGQEYSIPYSQLAIDTAYADADWIIISKHSTYVTVILQENYTVEFRNCHAYYRLKGSEKFDTIIVSQGPKDTFYITSNIRGRVLSNKKHEVYFDVFSNVEYSIEIPDSAKEWIQQITPIKTKYIFTDSWFGVNVLANEGEYREAYIKIQSKKSKEHQLIKIAQDGIFYTVDRAIADNPELSIFGQALISTGLNDSLKKYFDYTYPGVDYSWTLQAVLDGDPSHHFHATSVEKHESEVMPEERKFLFTVFVVKDSVLNADYGITSYSELVAFAEKVYPEGAGLPHNSRVSSINKLISYHILPYFLTYDQFNTCNDAIIKNYKSVYTANGTSNKNRVIDSEDFFATLLPHSIMRISTPWKSVDPPIRLGGIFINRKGVEGVKETTLEYEGTRIAENSEYDRDNQAENGIYHYVDKLLLYDEETKTKVLNCRMRIMACTLSPDFVNSGGRGRMRESHDIVYCYYPQFCENFDWVEGRTGPYVRYRDASFGSFNGDELTIMNNYDISLKLPPVPSSGTYELRIFNNAISGLGEGAADRGIVQFYFHEGNPAVDSTLYWRFWDWTPEGVSVDLRIAGDDERIGMIMDNSPDITNLLTEKEQQAAIDANDRAMRNRLYMKAMDSYGSLRTDKNCYRKIVWRRYMRDDTDYYLRMRQMYTEGTGVLPFYFIELVPKDVYDGNEDRH